MHRILGYILFSLFVGQNSARAAELTLEQAMQLSTQAPSLNAQVSRQQAAEAAVDLAGVLPEPMLGFSLQPVPVETRVGPQRGSISVQQDLPWPGLLAAQKRRARANSNGAFYSLDQQQRNHRLAAGNAWLTLWQLKRDIAGWQQLLDWHEQQAASIQAQYEAGLGGSSGRIQSALAAENAALKLAELRDQLAGTEMELARNIGESTLNAWSLPEDLLLPTGFPSEFNAGQHPLVLQAQAATEQANEALKVSQLKNRPGFRAGLRWILTDTADMPTTDSGKDPLIFSLNMKLPLWQSANRARTRVARQLKHKALAESQDRSLQLNTRWQQLQDQLQASRRNELRLREELIPLADNLLKVLQEEYKGGLARYDEVVQAARQSIELDLSHDRSKTRIWKTILELRELEKPAMTVDDKENK